MRIALQIFSWFSVVLGFLATIQGFAEMSEFVPDAGYSIFGGLLFLTEGILALVYIEDTK